MLLLFTPAFAGLIDSLTADERQVELCRAVAAPAEEAFDFKKASGIWDACLAEAKRTEATGAVALLQDRVALSKARARAAEWRTSDPNRYALEVLSVAADLRSLDLYGSDVATLFRAWMNTEAGKGRLEPMRTVTVVWQDTPADAAKGASELFRRYLQDLGLKWADPGTPEVDVIVYASLTTGAVDPATTGPAGSLKRAEAQIEADRVRFRTIDATTDGFRVKVTSEEPEAEVAAEAALDGVCQRAAARVLGQVLREVFP